MTLASPDTETSANEAGAPGAGPAASPSCRAGGGVVRRFALFAAAALVWVAADQLAKAHFDGGAYAVGEVVAGPFAGLFRFQLVHNTGMAWGLFGDSTFTLGVFSLVVCAAVAVLFCCIARRASVPEALGLALVLGGGVGNAIDRFAQGYVVDFIDLVFMDFPVFNIADIGVTCGFVLFVVGYLVRDARRGR